MEANHAPLFSYVASIEVNGGEGLELTNNTIIDNTVTGTNHAGTYISVNDGAQAILANNLFWGNDGAEITLIGGNDIYLYNNNIEDNEIRDFGSPPAEAENNVSIAPEFQPGGFSYELVTGSPLVDAGRLPPQSPPPTAPFKDTWELLANDVRGADRVRGDSVDIGAVESLPGVMFKDRFESLTPTNLRTRTP